MSVCSSAVSAASLFCLLAGAAAAAPLDPGGISSRPSLKSQVIHALPSGGGLGAGSPAPMAHDPRAEGPAHTSRTSALNCNGHAELCDRPYDQVSYPTTHNAFNYAFGPVQYGFPNQEYPVTRQLEDGVRALMLDVHEYNGFDSSHDGEIWLCHSYCWLGGEPLVGVLASIREFLDGHPGEVVSIIFENYVESAFIVEAFEESGLIQYVHAQQKGSPWPTLGQLINAGERMVVFTDDYGGDPAWLMKVWDFAVETNYSYQHRSDMSCDYNRGNPDNSLFILNHFLTYPLAARRLAAQVNRNPFLIDRADECWQATGKIPNFVTLDFYHLGDLFNVVDSLNGVVPAP